MNSIFIFIYWVPVFFLPEWPVHTYSDVLGTLLLILHIIELLERLKK